MLKTILTLCALCALLLVGCNKSETTNSNMDSTNKPAMASSSPAAMTSSPTAAKTSDSAGKIGVPECDEFLAAYDACVSKMPEVARAQYKATLASWRTAWLNAASTPQGKAGLAKTCKSAMEQSRVSMKPLGCNF